MKKFVIIVGLFLVALSYGAPRTVLYEEYTSVMG